MSADITILILTKNEEDNLTRTLESVAPFARRVVVVDSGSTDRTEEIVERVGNQRELASSMYMGTRGRWGTNWPTRWRTGVRRATCPRTA